MTRTPEAYSLGLAVEDDGTRLEYEPAIPAGAPTTMNAGEVASFLHETGDAVIVRPQDAEHPIYVSAHMTGGQGDLLGINPK